MQFIRFTFAKLLAAGLACACLGATASGAATDQAAVRHALMTEFDKPDARLTVDPVIVVGSHAVASWAQGARGGRALLARRGAAWQITLCAGDGVRSVNLLREAGVPRADAEALAKGLASAEAQLPAAQRAKFASFDGVVRMDANGQHPPAHKH